MVEKKRDKRERGQTKGKPKTKAQNEPNPLLYEILGIIIIALAIIAFFELGVVGRTIQTISMFFLGNLHFFIPFLAVFIAMTLMVRRRGVRLQKRVLIGLGLILASLAVFSHALLFEQLHKANLLLNDSVLRETWRLLISTQGIATRSDVLGGGMVGALLFSAFHILFDATGAKIAAIVLFLVGMILLTGKALVPYLVETAPNLKKIKLPKRKAKEKAEPPKPKTKRSKEQVWDEQSATIEESAEPIISAFTNNDQKEREMFNDPVETGKVDNEASVISNDENTLYQLPSLRLLEPPKEHDQSGEYAVIQSNAKKLEQTFLSFGVRAKVTQVHLGPAVTKYEVLPDVGVKVSKIVSLQDDLALALAAKDIRMEAPIPGKSAIGIEVPNSEIAVVTLREVLEAKENNKPNAKLLIGFGRDITGQATLAELNKMPHLLVAGSTGSGKSVCINGIIVSILMRAAPHEVKMMMIDPKMVELNVYNGIPHLLAPVVTDPRKAAQALQKVVSEMERRYDLFSSTGTRNIEGYNEHIEVQNAELEDKQPKLPYIVVIVDELADLMMVAPGEVEDAITRLAQMARAAGIHLILATQRPSVDVITGIIKANIPSRIAFAVSSAVDSRTILDMGGAEKLLGRGDMLFLPAGASKPTRVQGAFLSDAEVQQIVEYVIHQQKAQYEESMIPTDEPLQEISDEKDALYDDAVRMVVEMQGASVSMIQRKFRVGYARAARIVDQMEARGVVGPPDGSKPRQVLITKAMLE